MAKKTVDAVPAVKSDKKKKHEVLVSMDDARKAAGITLSNEELQFIAAFVKEVNA